MKKILLALMLVPLICMIILAVLSIKVYNSEVAKTYPNYQSLQADKVFENGWLPSYIPKSATMIELTYNKNSHNVFSSFYILGDDYQSLRNACKVLTEERTKLIFYCLDRNKEIRIRINKKGKAKLEAKIYTEKTKAVFE